MLGLCLHVSVKGRTIPARLTAPVLPEKTSGL